MSNYYASARTNYFKVKDPEAFKQWVDTLPDTTADYREKDEKFVLLVEGECGWPTERYNEDVEDYEAVNLEEGIVPHLAEGEVVIFQEIGAEKLRYLHGYSVAVAWTGETIRVDINDIYRLATEEFIGCNEITEALY